MSKKDKSDEDSDKDWRYDGAASKWDRFDSKVGRYARKRLSTLGDAFWKGFLPDLDDLDEASPEFTAPLRRSMGRDRGTGLSQGNASVSKQLGVLDD